MMPYVYIAIAAVLLSIFLLVFNFLNRRYIIIKVTDENTNHKRKIPYEKINIGIFIALFVTLTTCLTVYIVKKNQPKVSTLIMVNKIGFAAEYKVRTNNITNTNLNFSLIYYNLLNEIVDNILPPTQNLSSEEKLWFQLDTPDPNIYFANENFSIIFNFDGNGKLEKIESSDIILQATAKDADNLKKYIQYAYKLEYVTPNIILAEDSRMNVTYEPDIINIATLLTDFESQARSQYQKSTITLNYSKKA